MGAAQAFLHSSPQSRRTRDVGGLLEEPLGTVSEEQTLRGLCKELRMSFYYDSLAAKQRYVDETMRGTGMVHVHTLSKHQFWRLWEACYGEDMRRFLASANQGFCNKYYIRPGMIAAFILFTNLCQFEIPFRPFVGKGGLAFSTQDSIQFLSWWQNTFFTVVCPHDCGADSTKVLRLVPRLPNQLRMTLANRKSFSILYTETNFCVKIGRSERSVGWGLVSLSLLALVV